jgi:putative ABC transport system permease protein
MFRNVLAAALRNLARNRLYAAISIGGLAVGLAAAILTGLYLRDELAFDRFIPGYRNVYVVVSDIRIAGRPPILVDSTPAATGRQLTLDFKAVQAFARLMPAPAGVRRGEIMAVERIGWADPDLFSILPLPVVAGDPASALHRPDGAVITRAAARKYFGRDAPIGETLTLDGATALRVDAVLQDLPANTHLTQTIFVSSLNAASPTHPFDDHPEPRGAFGVAFRTYVSLPDRTAADRVNDAMPAFFLRHVALPDGKLESGMTASFRLVPLAALHLYPLGGTIMVNTNGQANPAALAALGLIALLILGVAGINFVNLMTARAARRAVEVGVRKAAGARRRDLVAQFIGEAVIYALVGLVLAMSATELVLPGMRALLDRPLDFAFWREPGLLAAAVGLALLVGVLAGVYPALVQSSFRPALVLKGGLPRTAGSARVRAGLATLQFAVLIGLILSVGVITRQTRYALNEGMRVDKAQTLFMDIRPPPGRAAAQNAPLCRDAFPDRVRALPGVLDAACSASTALDIGDAEISIGAPGGPVHGVGLAFVDHGFFELYGLKPLAGRFFSRDHLADEAPLTAPPYFPPQVAVINRKAALGLGFASPALAVGQSFRADYGPLGIRVRIIGVVPDFAFDLIHGGQRPMVYVALTPAFNTLSVKLNGQDIPGTLKRIDGLWRATGSLRPASYTFVDAQLQAIYAATLRQGYLIDALCGVAVFIAALGLLGLAAFTAERRTKEIGVRKSMGASRGDIVRLLLWQFAQPVLWASLIAWPVAWWAMDRWLDGFARHIALEPWLFVAASAAALLIACATVLTHTLRVARARPVGALRYE